MLTMLSNHEMTYFMIIIKAYLHRIDTGLGFIKKNLRLRIFLNPVFFLKSSIEVIWLVVIWVEEGFEENLNLRCFMKPDPEETNVLGKSNTSYYTILKFCDVYNHLSNKCKLNFEDLTFASKEGNALHQTQNLKLTH